MSTTDNTPSGRAEQLAYMYADAINGDGEPLAHELDAMTAMLREFMANCGTEGNHREALVYGMVADLCTIVQFMNIKTDD